MLVADAAARLRLAWALTLLTLIGATWPLWTPLREPPRVEPIALLGSPPPAIDFALLGLLAAGAVFAIAGRRSKVATAAVVGSLAALMAMDQLRWQPWAYHALLVGAAMWGCGDRRVLTLARLLAISVYFFAAVAKLDVTFADTLGQQFLSAATRPLGVDAAEWSQAQRRAAALAMPLGELLVAVSLGLSTRWSVWRRPGAVMAVGMHATTVGVLGPWALGHGAGVLLWNVGFAAQTAVLFWPAAAPPPSAPRRGQSVATAVVAFAVVAPLAYPLGGWDRWPSWGLYAPGGERGAVEVHASIVDRLPESIEVDEGSGRWRRVRVDRWVLEATGAPRYPQNRVSAALAAGLAERYPLGDRVRVIVESPADRFSGERRSRTVEGREALRAEAGLFGAAPQPVWTR